LKERWAGLIELSWWKRDCAQHRLWDPLYSIVKGV
jgi:hypothetical protein